MVDHGGAKSSFRKIYSYQNCHEVFGAQSSFRKKYIVTKTAMKQSFRKINYQNRHEVFGAESSFRKKWLPKLS
jgi:hypothetical protein